MEVVLEAQRAIIFNNRSQKQKQEAEKPGAMSGKGGWYSFTTETQRTQRKARADKGAGETLGCGKKTDTETRRRGDAGERLIPICVQQCTGSRYMYVA